MIKANTYNPEFNIVIHAVFIKKIKIGRRLKYGIGVRIPQCFFRMASGKCCSYMSIEFAVRQIISGKDTIAVNILHADNEIHSLSDRVCKGIKTFVITVCHKDGPNRVRVTINHCVKCGLR